MMQGMSCAPLWMMLHTNCSEDRGAVLSASEDNGKLGTEMMRPDMQCQQI